MMLDHILLSFGQGILRKCIPQCRVGMSEPMLFVRLSVSVQIIQIIIVQKCAAYEGLYVRFHVEFPMMPITEEGDLDGMVKKVSVSVMPIGFHFPEFLRADHITDKRKKFSQILILFGCHTILVVLLLKCVFCADAWGYVSRITSSVCPFVLQHRCKNTDDRADDAGEQSRFQHGGRDLDGFFHGFFHIGFQRGNGCAPIHPHAVFKVMH